MSAPAVRPALNRPEWADVHDLDAWDEDVETGDLVTVHERIVGEVGGVSVALVREDTWRDGVVTVGRLHIAISETRSPGLTFDDADLVADAIRRAMDMLWRIEPQA